MAYINPEAILDPTAYAATVEQMVADPDFSVHDYQFYTSLNWTHPHLTAEAGQFLETKLKEEIAELEQAIANPDDSIEHIIEEYGDVSWCLYAWASNANVPVAPYLASVLDYNDTEHTVRYTHDDFRTASVVSLAESPVIENYSSTPYGLFRRQPYKPIHVDETRYLDESLALIKNCSDALLNPTPDTNIRAMHDCLGSTVADLWLWFGHKASQRAGYNVVQAALAQNIRKINERTKNDYEFTDDK